MPVRGDRIRWRVNCANKAGSYGVREIRKGDGVGGYTGRNFIWQLQDRAVLLTVYVRVDGYLHPCVLRCAHSDFKLSVMMLCGKMFCFTGAFFITHLL
jgi:hypothetical protein